jgi:hypothetical protein
LREDTEKLGKVEKKKMKGMQQVEMLSQSFSSLLKIYRNKNKRIEAAEKKNIFFCLYSLEDNSPFKTGKAFFRSF